MVSSFEYILMVIMVMLSVSMFTLLERKILGYIQFRKGPNKIFMKGLFQPFADGMKLLSKTDSLVLWSNKILFYISPLLMMLISLICWWIIPLKWSVWSMDMSILSLMVLLGLMIYGLMFVGWSSNSKYTLIGSIRAVVQSLSYEVITSLFFLSFISLLKSLSLSHLMYMYKFTLISALCPVYFFIFFISTMIELNRSPFDLPEGESELVSGYCTEHGGWSYTLIFLSENMMIFFSSFIMSLLFFSFNEFIYLWLVWMIIILFIIILRGVLPRIRYDNLLIICWTKLLPLTIFIFNLLIVLFDAF